MRQRMVMVGLALCFGCATTTRSVHRPPLPDEVDAINNAAVLAGSLRVEHGSPVDQDAVGARVELPEGRLVAADAHRLTFSVPARPPLVVPTGQVRSVSVPDPAAGMTNGALIGGLVAIVAGIAVAAANGRNMDEHAGGGALVLATGFAVITVPLGMAVGRSGGRRTFKLAGEPAVVRPAPTDPAPWSP